MKGLFMPRSLAFVLCLLTLLAGCGGPPGATVGGKVTYQGKPLNSGRVYFNVGGGKAVRSALIQTDGSYSVEGLPEGQAQLAVVVPPAPRAMPNDPTAPAVQAPAVAPVEIPAKYEKVETSGLTYQVKMGEHSHDIALE
jgi:hypothetical protein